MKTIYELVRYQRKVYFKSSQFVMPFALMMAYLAFLYAMVPVSVVDSYVQSAILCFFIMVWAGLMYHNLEPVVSQQIILLRIKKDWKWYVSESLFLFFLALLAGTVCVVFPLVQSLIDGLVFQRQPMAGDIGSALLLHYMAGFTGGAVGMLFHPRILKERKLAVILTAVTALLAVVKNGLIHEFPIFRVVGWLFPPVAEFADRFVGQEVFAFGGLMQAAGLLLFYGAVVSVIRIWRLMVNKF